jgi:protein-disulfide isomerase
MRRIFDTRPNRRNWHPVLAVLLIAILAVIGWNVCRSIGVTGQDGPKDQTALKASLNHSPPWVYGRLDARFTVIEYADLECPYCKAHFSVMRNWIDQDGQRSERSSVNWQWQHLPLPGHEPAASQSAMLTECAGRTHGNQAFWRTAEWVFQHTRGGGQGISPHTAIPDMRALATCLQDAGIARQIQQQVAQAHQTGITATPTLVLRDNSNGKAVRLPGPASGDALLSAMDWLISSAAETTPTSESNMPVDKSVNDMPR